MFNKYRIKITRELDDTVLADTPITADGAIRILSIILNNEGSEEPIRNKPIKKWTRNTDLKPEYTKPEISPEIEIEEEPIPSKNPINKALFDKIKVQQQEGKTVGELMKLFKLPMQEINIICTTKVFYEYIKKRIRVGLTDIVLDE